MKLKLIALTLLVVYYPSTTLRARTLKIIETTNIEEEVKRAKNALETGGEKHFIEIYSPSKGTCRPTIRKGGDHVDIEIGLREIACMLAGKKDVGWWDLKLFEQLPALQPIMKKRGIGILKTSEWEAIYYTPKGKKHALLLAKASKSPAALSAYLMGFLLGYPEEDIRAFYERSYNDLPKGGTAYFEKAKKAAQVWLKKNS